MGYWPVCEAGKGHSMSESWVSGLHVRLVKATI